MRKPSNLLKGAIRPLFYKPAPELRVDDEVMLRELRVEDADPIYAMIEINRSHLEGWLSWIDLIHNREDAADFVKRVSYRDVFDGGWVYGIWHNDRLVGLLDFNEGDRKLRQISIGYWLTLQAQGKGIVTRAVVGCLDYVFSEARVFKVLIKCATNNFRSQAVPIRLRFNWEGLQRNAGTVKDQEVDLEIFSMTSHEWERLREKEKEKKV